jgi:hypothetical protein
MNFTPDSFLFLMKKNPITDVDKVIIQRLLKSQCESTIDTLNVNYFEEKDDCCICYKPTNYKAVQCNHSVCLRCYGKLPKVLQNIGLRNDSDHIDMFYDCIVTHCPMCRQILCFLHENRVFKIES